MTPDEYIRIVLAKYHVPTGLGSAAHQMRQILLPDIQAWAGPSLRAFEYSGSYAKGTAIRLATDVDLFISLASDTQGTLREIYNSLFDFLRRKGRNPRRRNVSIGLTYGSLKVDLVPARKHEGHTNDHSLYRSRADTWIKTNVHAHIQLIANSGRTDEIRAIKVWRELHGVDFPSVYLELTVMNALYGRRSGQLADNTVAVLQYLAGAFVGARVVDPANTNNIISDELTAVERIRVASKARDSLNQPWGRIVW